MPGPQIDLLSVSEKHVPLISFQSPFHEIADMTMKEDAVVWSLILSNGVITFGLLLYKRLKVGQVMQHSLFNLILRDGVY